jgi:5'-nucleotidase
MIMQNKPTILIINDDGVFAPGIRALIKVMRTLGTVTVVAPDQPQSGQGHAITVMHPLRYHLIADEPDYKEYSVSGTPVDCVKLGEKVLLRKKPDLLVSGINHGSNTSINILYSGTMAAVLEGCMIQVPSIGFSLDNYSHMADFEPSLPWVKKIAEVVLEHGLPKGVCLNVNLPACKAEEINGIKICRQGDGTWEEIYDERKDPRQRDYFWITGNFNGFDNLPDTDNWALQNNYVALTPVKYDLTAHETIENLKNLF